ncbi:MAG TPA: pilus assembly PilX N-terminal domain-containing protein [Thermoanaerobaculia bacterium]
MTTRRRPSGEAVLLLVILGLAVLAVIGIALQFSTSAERAIAVNEWSVARSLYAADAGIRWAACRMRTPTQFLARPEFREPPDPFGTVSFPLPGHPHGPAGPFSGDPDEKGILVTVQAPSFLGRRLYVGDGAPGRYIYAFEIRVRASENAPVPRYMKELVADVEVGPLPEDLFARLTAPPPGDRSPRIMTAQLREQGVRTSPIRDRPALTAAFPRAIISKALSAGEEADLTEDGSFRLVTMNWKEQ